MIKKRLTFEDLIYKLYEDYERTDI